MVNKGTVAIIGSPNVGKSSLFNRLVQQRVAVIADVPGVTKDRLYGICNWMNCTFNIIDTGGIVNIDQKLHLDIKEQALVAAQEADVIMFVVSFLLGVTNEDQYISRTLRKLNKPVVLIINKYDAKKAPETIYQFMELGIKHYFCVSAAHGIGIGHMLDYIVKALPNITNDHKPQHTSFCIIGKPNVGKSTLTNAILQKKRVIVNDEAGTTIDAVFSDFKYQNNHYTIVDTAGIRKRSKNGVFIEKYSFLRTLKAIDLADIAVLLIDGSERISNQDTHIAGIASQKDKPVLIVVNKIDLWDKNASEKSLAVKKEIANNFKFIDYASVICVSALVETNLHIIFECLRSMKQNLSKKIKTSILNEIMVKAQLLNPPPHFKGGRLKIYYITQKEQQLLPTFIFFVNNLNYLHFSYKRFLKNQIKINFAFNNIPIKLTFKNRKE